MRLPLPTHSANAAQGSGCAAAAVFLICCGRRVCRWRPTTEDRRVDARCCARPVPAAVLSDSIELESSTRVERRSSRIARQRRLPRLDRAGERARISLLRETQSQR